MENFWIAVNTLPLPFMVLVVCLTVLLIFSLALFPLYLLFKHEAATLPQWVKDQYAEILKAPKPSQPLQKIALIFDTINLTFGRVVAWLILGMVLMQFSVVVLRYVFSWGSVQMQESIWYMHGLVFTFAVGYTLLREGHVRIDIFYNSVSQKTKAWINIIGVILFIIPTCWVTLEIAFPYVANAWEVKEGSTEGTGLHFVYLIKTSILFFGMLLLIQGLSLLLKSMVILQQIRHNLSNH